MGFLVTCSRLCIVYFGLIHLPFTLSSPYGSPSFSQMSPSSLRSNISLILKFGLYNWEKISDICLSEPGLFHLTHCSPVLSIGLKMTEICSFYWMSNILYYIYRYYFSLKWSALSCFFVCHDFGCFCQNWIFESNNPVNQISSFQRIY